jgi:hypothetical protein
MAVDWQERLGAAHAARFTGGKNYSSKHSDELAVSSKR